MHLSDEQLLDLRLAETTYDKKSHLGQCLHCQQRLEHLANFRQTLSDIKIPKMETDQWLTLQQEFVTNNSQKQHFQLKSKIRRLQIGLVAIAASLMVVLIYPSINNLEQNLASNNYEMQLSAIINENNQLQTIISNNKKNNAQVAVATKSLEFKLNIIDQQIQRSYLENLPIVEKIRLWELRRDTLNQSLETKVNYLSGTI